ncbi:hypothetical protein TNCV_3791171 [Trichonephila clavipes]|nr:hypothetical protein TNCV_3791171 [Trichonephila clavipes]
MFETHSGNLGNDRADQLAKEAICQDMNLLISVSFSCWKHVAWERTVSSWSTEFLASPKALRTKRAVGSLVVRASDSRPEGLGSNTLRLHTEYVLVKSVGSKVSWAEIASAGYWRIFHSPSLPCLNCGGGVAIYRKEFQPVSQALSTFIPSLREFHRAKFYCGAQGLPRTKNSRSAEFAGRRFISQDHIIAKLVPTKKVSVQCVGKNFWIRRTTSSRPPERVLTSSNGQPFASFGGTFFIHL